MNPAQAYRPVVVGVDGSESALQAVAWAAGEAHRRRVPLRLVSAFGWTAGHHLGDPGLGTDYLAVLL
jgi:nucleotide-binding universal stress UspA family protein